MKNKEVLNKKIVITGGGSGGHVSAVQSLISELESRYILNDNNFMYIGGDLGMVGEKTGNSIEQRTFRDTDIQCKYIRAGKLQRALSFSSLKLFFRTFLGLIDSYKILKNFKPEIVISTGGFVSVPVCLVSKLLGAKIYLHEQTSAIGLANKLVSKISEKIFITFPSSQKYFPKDKTIQTGNLVREELLSPKNNGKTSTVIKGMLKEQQKYPILYISGGSLGSHIINETVKDSLSNLLDSVQLILQTGDNSQFKDFELLENEKLKLSKEKQSRVYITKYIDSKEIGFIFKNIDIFLGRAGANTVYEIGIFKIPSIFIPIPWVTHNEQYQNAKILKDIGLSEIINEGELTPEKLISVVKKILKKDNSINNDLLEEIFITSASKKIIDHILK